MVSSTIAATWVVSMILSSVNILLGTISPYDGRCGENFAVFGEELTKAYTWILATLILFMPLVILIKILTLKVNVNMVFLSFK